MVNKKRLNKKHSLNFQKNKKQSLVILKKLGNIWMIAQWERLYGKKEVRNKKLHLLLKTAIYSAEYRRKSLIFFVLLLFHVVLAG